MKKLLFFLFLLFAISASPLCPGPTSTDLIQTGIAELQLSKIDFSSQCYTIAIQYDVPPSGYKTALSLAQAPRSSRSGEYYAVKGGKNGQSNNFSIVVVTRGVNWRKVSISYLVSSRHDLLVGSVLLDPYYEFNCDQIGNKKLIKAPITGLKPSQKYSGNIFISGIETSNPNLDLTINLLEIDPKKSEITIEINPESISLVQISYIIQSSAFAFNTQIRNQIFGSDDYSFKGIVEYQQTKQYKVLAFNSQKLYCIGSQCQQKCTTKIGCQLVKGTIKEKTCFACKQDQEYKNSKCVSICRSNQIFENGKCVRPSCPRNSYWDRNQLSCICYDQEEHVIDGKCQECPENQQWDISTKSCQCEENKYKVNGQCISCGLHQRYNENDGICECNYGFYRNQGSEFGCSSCHPSCGRCSGPYQGQCLQCSDISYTFNNGYCVREDPCPRGLYLNKQSCKPCSAYCDKCANQNICETCIEGFDQAQIFYGGIRAAYCVQKCGDGKRFEYECDDGNLKDGDGCNKDCETQKGWVCLGGSTVKPSECTQTIPDKTEISLTGSVHLFGRIVQGVRLSYLPDQLAANDCPSCSKLLWIRVVQSHIVPGVRINYLPKSKYQFLIDFEFNGLFAIPVFRFTVQINPEFRKYFSTADLAQIQVKEVDPSTLKLSFIDETLDLNSLDDEPQVSPNLVAKVFK